MKQKRVSLRRSRWRPDKSEKRRLRDGWKKAQLIPAGTPQMRKKTAHTGRTLEDKSSRTKPLNDLRGLGVQHAQHEDLTPWHDGLQSKVQVALDKGLLRRPSATRTAEIR